MRGSRGFTLIELLAVIAIVAVLAGLITSAAQSARANADRAVAVSQMRQIGTALFLEVADQNGRLPGPMKSGQGSVYQTGKRTNSPPCSVRISAAGPWRMAPS